MQDRYTALQEPRSATGLGLQPLSLLEGTLLNTAQEQTTYKSAWDA